MKKIIYKTLIYLLLVIVSITMLVPFLWMFLTAFKTVAETMQVDPFVIIPKVWQTQNFGNVVKAMDFAKLYFNTLAMVGLRILFAILTATLSGYAFARLRFRGKKFLFTLCVGSMLLPSMVTLIPIFFAWSKIGLVNTYWPLILPHFCGGGAFNIFLIRQFVKTVPRELDEAATIDGCGYFRILIFIIVPAIKAAMIVVGLLKFIELWNDLLQQVTYITRRDRYTLALGLNIFRGSFNDDWSSIMCATCLSFIPGIVFYLIGQKYFVEGIVMTGMKN